MSTVYLNRNPNKGVFPYGKEPVQTIGIWPFDSELDNFMWDELRRITPLLIGKVEAKKIPPSDLVDLPGGASWAERFIKNYLQVASTLQKSYHSADSAEWWEQFKLLGYSNKPIWQNVIQSFYVLYLDKEIPEVFYNPSAKNALSPKSPWDKLIDGVSSVGDRAKTSALTFAAFAVIATVAVGWTANKIKPLFGK